MLKDKLQANVLHGSVFASQSVPRSVCHGSIGLLA
jgi:hypothetical protein